LSRAAGAAELLASNVADSEEGKARGVDLDVSAALGAPKLGCPEEMPVGKPPGPHKAAAEGLMGTGTVFPTFLLKRTRSTKRAISPYKDPVRSKSCMRR
jgi:hypothetical protein